MEPAERRWLSSDGHWSAYNLLRLTSPVSSWQPQASAIGSSGNHGARMLLPFSSHKQRIPEELAERIGALAGASRPTALLVAPSSGKVWRVEVALDGDGAFLGRGWPEFAGAHGIGGTGWFLVLRYHGGGVLTVKAFDATCCLKELGAPAVVEATRSRKATSHKPQFIYLLQPALKEKMLIPSNFVQHYIPRKHLRNHFAVILSPLGKFWRIGIEVNQSDVCFAGGWSEFLSFHGIIEGNALLLRYEDNMSFTVKVFGSDGSQIQSKHNGTRIRQIPIVPDIEKQQESTFASGNKRRSRNEKSSGEGQKRPKHSMTYLDNALSRKKSVYEIGPQSWIMKEINKNTLEKHLSLATAFCDAIGLREPCMIMLKNSMDSTRSWQVRGIPYKYSSCQIGSGWKRFCQDNRLKEGDVCTFNIIKTTLWHVDIKRGKSLARTFCNGIGFRKPCMITLKTSMDSTRCWKVRGLPYNNSSLQLGMGWKKFCQENKLKVGDICTFYVIKPSLWHVVIARR